MIIYSGYYSGESVHEFDAADVLDKRFNPDMAFIPVDEHGFMTGRFKVIIEWEPYETE